MRHPALVITECPHCGSTALTWQPTNLNRTGIQNGRLNTSDVECLFVLGCDHCSETLGGVSAEQVAGMMNAQLLRFAGWTACSERLPTCSHEDEDGLLSDSLLVCDVNSWPNLGMAHLREGGGWQLYGGDHDFMHPDTITHWMPLPGSPVRPAAVQAPQVKAVQP